MCGQSRTFHLTSQRNKSGRYCMIQKINPRPLWNLEQMPKQQRYISWNIHWNWLKMLFIKPNLFSTFLLFIYDNFFQNQAGMKMNNNCTGKYSHFNWPKITRTSFSHAAWSHNFKFSRLVFFIIFLMSV